MLYKLMVNDYIDWYLVLILWEKFDYDIVAVQTPQSWGFAIRYIAIERDQTL